MFAADIILACGHGWPGECESRAEAGEFVALCILTGDDALCPSCGRQRITGPLVERTYPEPRDSGVLEQRVPRDATEAPQ